MRERNGERFYETSDVNMDKVHAAMTAVGRRASSPIIDRMLGEVMPSNHTIAQCMLCASQIVYKDGVWWMVNPGDSMDPWWKDHCTGHDLGGLRRENPDLVHTPRPDLLDPVALEDWLDG